jgi:hypothetical protein
MLSLTLNASAASSGAQESPRLQVSPLLPLALLDHLARSSAGDTPVLGLLMGTGLDDVCAALPCVEFDLVSDYLSLHSHVYPKHSPLGLYRIAPSSSCGSAAHLTQKDIRQLSLTLEALSAVFEDGSALEDPLLLLTLCPLTLQVQAFAMEPTSSSSGASKELTHDDDHPDEPSCGLLLSPLPLSLSPSSALESEGGMSLASQFTHSTIHSLTHSLTIQKKYKKSNLLQRLLKKRIKWLLSLTWKPFKKKWRPCLTPCSKCVIMSPKSR